MLLHTDRRNNPSFLLVMEVILKPQQEILSSWNLQRHYTDPGTNPFPIPVLELPHIPYQFLH